MNCSDRNCKRARLRAIAICVGLAMVGAQAMAQYAQVEVDSGTDRTRYSGSGPHSALSQGQPRAAVFVDAPGAGGTQIISTPSSIQMETYAPAQSNPSSSLLLNTSEVRTTAADQVSGNASTVSVRPQEAYMSTVNAATGNIAGSNTTLNGTFTGVLNSGLAPISGLMTSDDGTNTLVGNTKNTGTLSVLGVSATNGIVNAGNIGTSTLTTTSNATIGGTLSVTGTSTTHGILNTGNISTDTLTVTGRTRTAGIDNGGQTITNVAPGVAPTDAANVGQVDAMAQGLAATTAQQAAINAAQQNINATQQLTTHRMQQQMSENRRVAGTGAAVALAAASVPALETGKRIGVGLGVASYDGQSAISLSVAARVSEQLQLKFNVGTGPGGKVGAGAGGLWSW
ncbi:MULTISPECIES: YadA-like family protein [unclassified Variovorax]|uniref:YadA-like family protein n=1 Tax=unclassified Variovorax TaxID=663243 RepID=UPI0032E76F09